MRLKAEETARKRADIEACHSKWETELRSQMQTGLSTLKGRLVAIRSAAAAELAEAPDIRDAIENLVAKYIKGAEIYLRNLRAESRKNDEKTPLWERVVEKVGVKFSERLGVVEAVVNTWYSAILDQELREVSYLLFPVVFCVFPPVCDCQSFPLVSDHCLSNLYFCAHHSASCPPAHLMVSHD